jgi:hypothetical protein
MVFELSKLRLYIYKFIVFAMMRLKTLGKFC